MLLYSKIEGPKAPAAMSVSPPPYNDCASEMSDCSSMEEGRETSNNRRGNTIITIRQDRKARRVESNNRERRRMHELNHAFQVGILYCLVIISFTFIERRLTLYAEG